MKSTIAILANSIRHGNRCIAGREMLRLKGKWVFGPWLRPVSPEGEGALRPHESAFAGGGQPAVLDAVELTLSARQQCVYQPENFLIAPGQPWRRLGTIPPRSLGQVEERPQHLWLQGRGQRTDRISLRLALQAVHPFQSLYLIRPASLRFRIWEQEDEFHDHPHKQRRALFTYAGMEYDLPITDPTMDRRYFHSFPALGQPPREIACKSPPNCLLVVSLALPFKDGYHYKVVATVLEY